MVGAKDPLSLTQRLQVDVAGTEAVSDQAQVNREVVRKRQRAGMIAA